LLRSRKGTGEGFGELQRTLSFCVLVAIVVLVSQAGDLSVDARDFIQSRLEELRIALQPN
jgi:hypothetical protein